HGDRDREEHNRDPCDPAPCLVALAEHETETQRGERAECGDVGRDLRAAAVEAAEVPWEGQLQPDPGGKGKWKDGETDESSEDGRSADEREREGEEARRPARLRDGHGVGEVRKEPVD